MSLLNSLLAIHLYNIYTKHVAPTRYMDGYVACGKRREPFSLCSDTYKIFCHRRRRAVAYIENIYKGDWLQIERHTSVKYSLAHICAFGLFVFCRTTRARKQTMLCQHIVDVFQFNFDGMCGGGGGGSIRKQKFNLKHTLIKLIYVYIGGERNHSKIPRMHQ